jgi:transketolase
MDSAIGSPPESSISAAEFRRLTQLAKARLLSMHYESGVGHIGREPFCTRYFVCLHHTVLREDDVFVLSKGHSAGALYGTLWSVSPRGR